MMCTVRTREKDNNYRAATLRRRGREGMTLVEIMIVVIIMALIATAVGLAVIPAWERTQVRQTRSDAQTVRAGAETYYLENSECPTMAALVEQRILDSGKRTQDAWDNDFQIECQGGDITVISSGPDEQMGTEDDISTAAQ